MQDIYRPQDIESHVQQHWNQAQTFTVKEDPKKEKYYCLAMWPYPSGRLHMGHVRNYTITDVIARYQRMLGKNVLQPIGWDAFGLPAEGAAIKNKTSPLDWTKANIQYMKKQLQSLGFSYDWSRELTSCKPEYYRWEQWFFTQLYEKGLVYNKTSDVNWCPQDFTVLANEQVIDGRCWRCDSKVERKSIPQWFIKITAYADQLLDDLDELEHWPEQVKTMQRHWIGRSEGVTIRFTLDHDEKTDLTVYSTRPDTLMGVTFIAIAPDHFFSTEIAKDFPSVSTFIDEYRHIKMTEAERAAIEKKGIDTGFFALHPLTGEKIPIWVANFVFMEYETSAIMGVPGHNQRDWEFATQYHLPIKTVILLEDGTEPDVKKKPLIETGRLCHSGEFNGLLYKESRDRIIDKLVDLGTGQRKVNYRLRDWGVSRQRYWGAPIPIITLEDGRIIGTPEDQLPVILPEKTFIKDMINPLKADQDWAKTSISGQLGIRETDTFDTFMESSWYYARYACPKYDQGMIEKSAANYWLPVDQYVGGIEHAIMHLLYFRFFHKLMRDQGLVYSKEPVKRLLCQGMVLADAFYYNAQNGERVWISPTDVTIERDNKGQFLNAFDAKGHHLIHAGMSKMSKSKNNGIDPQTMVEKYGADTVRLFMMFASAPEINLEWQESGLEGAYRFLKRLWRFVFDHIIQGPTQPLKKENLNSAQKKLRRNLHKTIAKVTDDIGRRQTFNTAISVIMELMNQLYRAPINTEQDRALIQEACISVIKMLYPFTPHISFVLWQYLHKSHDETHPLDIDDSLWPVVDQSALIEDETLVVIQINGKIRAKITVPMNSTQQAVYKSTLQEPTIIKHLNGITPSHVIYIPNKLLNLVLNNE
ncbi:leucine--tRNA ligase [Candidatus Williamhamiltonella defendens]|uniref:leucine--tRNA ligase n=1 Tax=Candidatus Williamhamiltonella defendens TaxID=138072 RepID=UPI00130D5F08|nr:leucine--tRNA ligase [Candidatus Hamiltonella defensa]